VNKPAKANALHAAANEKVKHHKASLADVVWSAQVQGQLTKECLTWVEIRITLQYKVNTHG
jgi:hypothetical protein